MLDLSWHWPWAFLLLPLPWFVYRFSPPRSQPAQAPLTVSYLQRFHLVNTNSGRPTASSWPKRSGLLSAFLWFCVITALARPYQLGDVLELPISGRDLLLAVDLSQSMEIEDMQLNNRPVDRLVVLKKVLNEFIERRVGDRLGLVLFGSEAYLQAPLTFDRPTVQQLMNEAQIGLAGPQTAIGDALGLSVKRLLQQPADSRVIILVTDGANNSGELEPLKAAELAAANHIKIYAIGLGADSMRVSGFFGSRTINPTEDMDEDTLRTLTQRTGGQYFRARNANELEEIYQILDQLEPTEQDPEVFRPQKNLYYWPLLLALAFSFLLVFEQHGIRRTPRKSHAD